MHAFVVRVSVTSLAVCSHTSVIQLSREMLSAYAQTLANGAARKLSANDSGRAQSYSTIARTKCLPAMDARRSSGLVVECDVAADLGEINQAASELRGELQEARELGRLRYRGDIRHIHG